ncbi:hypothetical protein H257_10951 [Aphanomyces astaci]|uniref:FAD-binding FR-type domain-containing protein n=1 Tax=Aphanomyces astaci TaxID=112090 RepID=W4G4Y3_APHAT|nr:hypothetical protein H257_10951 [Aphanomyces astaci]ETV74356.1 hypothetical protein H257_10951 [Aphanomyces astaci]RQM25239.1 hypothetical protein B5M09_002982 [Aphanomyces astaci]|eukprot:XP_009836014.1 hypothetical protein H257_10951 [Aphanomyces astaci]
MDPISTTYQVVEVSSATTASSLQSASSSRHRAINSGTLVRFRQVLVAVCMMLMGLTPFAYFHPAYDRWISSALIRAWGGIPALVSRTKTSGHSEMAMPTYFVCGMAFPLLIGAAIFAGMEHHNPPLSTLLSRWLQRKPKAFGHAVSNGEVLFLMIWLGGNVAVFGYQWAKRYKPQDASVGHVLEVVALNLAFNGLFNMSVLALPATRHSFWMQFLHISYAHGIKYHRWLGVATIVAFTGHMCHYVALFAVRNSLSLLLPCFSCNVATDGYLQWTITFGGLAYVCFVGMAVTSVPYIRRHHYAVFRSAHWLFLPATVFAVLHWGPILNWLFASMVVYLANRWLSSSSNHPVQVEVAGVFPSIQTCHVTLHCTTPYAPGDVVWLNVPTVSPTQWHPFSVASTPVHTPGLLTVFVRNVGPWTSNLYAYIQDCTAAKVDPIVYVDMPTISVLEPATLLSSSVVFVGGGIGITPLMGQLLHVLHSPQQRPGQIVWLLWHVPDVSMLWCFQSWLQDIEALAAKHGTRLHIRLHVTQECEMGAMHNDDEGDVASMMMVDESMATFLQGEAQRMQGVHPRPYVHVNRYQQIWVLAVAVVCSGGLVASVKYGNVISKTLNPSWWPLQRFIEYVLVVLGSLVALGLAKLWGRRDAVPNIVCQLDDAATKSTSKTDVEALVLHHNVQRGRVVWPDFVQEILQGQSALSSASIGVFVSGPSALQRAVDLHFQPHPLFHVHAEEFEM